MKTSPLSIFLAAAVAALALLPAAVAEDAPPVDAALILRTLKTLRDTETQQSKSGKLKALQQMQSAAADPARAVEMWEDAVRATQFDGASRETTIFHDWKDKEGDALKEKECANALYLYYTWVGLTLQRSSGAKVKDLLPALINYTKEVTADDATMEAFDDAATHEKEIEGNRKQRGPAPKKNNDQVVRKMHDQILKQSIDSSVVVQWLRIAPFLEEAGKPAGSQQPPPQQGGGSWELTPDNVDGIFQKIILPELRVERDPRVIEYWDMKIRLEADEATRTKKVFDADKFNQVRRPQLLWDRALDMIAIGQKNRGLGEMYKLVQAYPAHPDAATWMTSLEQALLPPAPAAPAGSADGAATPATAAAPAAP